MIDSKILHEKLNDKSVIDWLNDDKSPLSYKQGYLSGIIKALSIVSEVEYFTKYGHDRPPIDFEVDDETSESLKIVMGAVNDKIKELELTRHSEKDIVNGCIWLMEDVLEKMMEYMEMMDVEHTEGVPTLKYSYFEIVQKLLLCRTMHGGGTSTRKKCEQLGFDSYATITIGETED
jgi:hypothetical protein